MKNKKKLGIYTQTIVFNKINFNLDSEQNDECIDFIMLGVFWFLCLSSIVILGAVNSLNLQNIKFWLYVGKYYLK